MKNLLKKLSIGSNQGDDSEGSTSSRSPKQNAGFAPEPQHHSEHNKPFTALTGWLQSVTNRKSPSPPSPSNAKRQVRVDQSDSASSGAFELASDVARHDSESSNLKDRDMDEQYQIQLAMEMSAREDPEAVQIEAVKQMSLGSCPHENTPAEVVAYRYWNYNALSYDDKILDGFYDLYGVPTESTSSKMPSLIDLQAKPVSEGISWEAILVNRAADANLLKLEERAMVLASKSMSDPLLYTESGLVRALAILVSDYMGGPVADPDTMLRAWKSLSYSLKSTLKSMVLPLGSLTIGLARHRALLFKVLADKLGIPCRLVKGRQYTGFDDVAMNFVKIDDGREFIVDLMAAPGTMIPSDAAGTYVDNSEFISSPIAVSKDTDSSNIGSCSSGPLGLFDELSECETAEWRSSLKKWPAGAEDPVSEPAVSAISLRRGTESEDPQTSSDDKRNTCKLEKLRVQDLPSRAHYTFSHARTPSWTEGVSSPAVQKMKVKDVSQYMIDAAKENPHLAQKLHDVLLESGVVAPPNLFTGIYAEHADASTTKSKLQIEHKEETRKMHVTEPHKGQDYSERSQFLPPLPQHGPPRVAPILQLENPKPIEGGLNNVLAQCGLSGHAPSQSDMAPMKFGKNVPVAAAAAAAAAVVASSMVVAATKSSPDPKFELPVAAAATATAAAVVATTAAVGKQYERLDSSPHSPSDGAACFNQVDGSWSGDADDASREPSGSGNKMNDASGITSEGERVSDRSAGTDSAKSDVQLDDVADCEISWDEITLGERIGLGSYGEVYRGDWHGTEVAVKKFLDQDISGESLEEFKSEVRIMKRLRHPNIVLFMGAVTRPPNLCIVTEFLPRGSLYRLLHRPNNQLDERRRLKMALDMARGMNYLHNCSPVIVHRDLKSPNLLVDRNWIVKVCDFGLSRMKHSTFLSSRSTAGTAEWMAPELLRNEPSNEKCDVYSFGVILWELCTLQQPWEGMNPMQVVGAVGFQHRRLDIPDYIDPAIAEIILKCWHTDPKLRPTFAEIMAALKPLQKPVQVPRPRLSRSGDHGQV